MYSRMPVDTVELRDVTRWLPSGQLVLAVVQSSPGTGPNIFTHESPPSTPATSVYRNHELSGHQGEGMSYSQAYVDDEEVSASFKSGITLQ